MKRNSNFMQRFLLVMFAISASICASAYDFSIKNSDGIMIYYNIISEEDKTCEVTAQTERDMDDYIATDYVGVVNIPSEVIGYHVTRIGKDAFVCCRGLTFVSIPNSVTTIEFEAFGDCRSLTSIEIPNSVTFIGERAFMYCRSLTSIEIPNSVTTIGFEAFSGCSSLTSIVIGNSVTSMNCSYTVEGITESFPLGYGTFADCPNLSNIVVEDGNPKYNSLNNCNAIIETSTNALLLGCSNTVIPPSVTSIGEYAFCGCTGLTSMTIPNSVTSIGDYAFSGCTSLTSVTIPNSVASIGWCAFSGCSGLTSITSYIKVLVDDILDYDAGSTPFDNCFNATLYVPKGMVSTYQSMFVWNLFSKIVEIPGFTFFLGCNDKGKVLINDNTEFTNDMIETSTYDDANSIIIFTPNEGCKLSQVLVDGLDVTRSVKDNRLTAKLHENAKMFVVFSDDSGDINGDGFVNITDVVALVNIILGK